MLEVPQLLSSVAGSFTRWALGSLGASLVTKGIISSGDMELLIAGAGMLLASIAWSIWQKLRAHNLLMTALDLPAKTPLVDAKQEAGRAKLLSILLPLALAVSVLGLSACNNKTTLAKIGAVLTTGAQIYNSEIDALKSQGALTDEQYARLKPRAVAIVQHAQSTAATIASFPNVSKENAAQIAAQIGVLVSDLESALGDPDLANLGPDSKAQKVLVYVRASANAAALALSAIFPPAPVGVETNSVRQYSPVRADKIVIELPAKPKGF